MKGKLIQKDDGIFLSIPDPATNHMAHEATKNKTKALLQVQEFELLCTGLGTTSRN